jgi:plastocyanin
VPGKGTSIRAICRTAALLTVSAAALLLAPTTASAADGPSDCDTGVPTTDPNGPATRYTCTFPFSVEGFGVKQTIGFVDHPGTSNSNATISHMEVDIVGDQDPATHDPVPIQRLMLHHIVFLNLGRQDQTCPNGYIGFDNRPDYFGGVGAERFYAAGEERLKLTLPQGYGYTGDNPGSAWGMVYMVMNHRKVVDDANIQYSYTVSNNPQKPVTPYWLDEVNCHTDPIYNVPGTRPRGSSDVRSSDYVMPVDGRIVAGAGHVHGGARKLTLSQPDCNNRQVIQSIPTWGFANHPFYNVRPILHEPGPISMSGILSQKGYPIAKGERVRLTADYDAQRPHTRVMGISMIYVAHRDVAKCGKPPGDIQHIQPAELYGTPYRKHTPTFTVPLTGLDKNGNAHEIEQPAGARVPKPDGATISVGSHFFGPPNVAVQRGSVLNWKFNSTGYEGLHNVTLASGPRGFSSPNLNDGRAFKFRFKAPGKYKLFCALHPVQMQQTVLVK